MAALSTWRVLVVRFARNESAAPAVEYALMAAFIALVMATGAVLMGDGLNRLTGGIGQGLQAIDLGPLSSTDSDGCGNNGGGDGTGGDNGGGQGGGNTC